MSISQNRLNPFSLIMEPDQVLNMMSHSDQLRSLRTKRLRPLDNKNPLLQPKIKPAAKNANNYGLKKTPLNDPLGLFKYTLN